eukprot:GHRQ01017350.1.p1 GENE.GHRQ01017350.1~~GHRQ01017350.1.p1  ORF type:complete len:224 (+),score=84.98 GHRQ01017350.1:920-1591(+)
MASGAATMLRNKILSCCTPRASNTCSGNGERNAACTGHSPVLFVMAKAAALLTNSSTTMAVFTCAAYTSKSLNVFHVPLTQGACKHRAAYQALLQASPAPPCTLCAPCPPAGPAAARGAPQCHSAAAHTPPPSPPARRAWGRQQQQQQQRQQQVSAKTRQKPAADDRHWLVHHQMAALLLVLLVLVLLLLLLLPAPRLLLLRWLLLRWLIAAWWRVVVASLLP